MQGVRPKVHLKVSRVNNHEVRHQSRVQAVSPFRARIKRPWRIFSYARQCDGVMTVRNTPYQLPSLVSTYSNSLQRHLARHRDTYRTNPSGRSKRACIGMDVDEKTMTNTCIFGQTSNVTKSPDPKGPTEARNASDAFKLTGPTSLVDWSTVRPTVGSLFSSVSRILLHSFPSPLDARPSSIVHRPGRRRDTLVVSSAKMRRAWLRDRHTQTRFRSIHICLYTICSQC